MSSSPPEHPATQTPDDWQRLLDFILAHPGRFALGLARGVDHAQRRGIIESMRAHAAGAGVALLVHDASANSGPSLLGTLVAACRAAHHNPADPILLTGLDAAVLGGESPESNAFLRALNLERDRWRRELHGVVVIWLDPVADRALRLGAPDFVDYAEGYFAFPPAPERPLGPGPVGDLSPLRPSALRHGQHAGSERYLRRVLARHHLVLEELGDLNHLTGPAALRAGDSLLEVATAKHGLGEPDAAEYALRAAAAFRSAANIGREADARLRAATLLSDRYRYDEASLSLETASVQYRQVGDLLGEANCIKSLGDIALERSDHDGARARYEEALPLYRRVGSVLGEANCIQSLGDIALERSDHDGARAHFNAALVMFEHIAEPYSIGFALLRLAQLTADAVERAALMARAEGQWTNIGRNDLINQFLRKRP